MLTYTEFIIIFIVAIIFLKPKDIIYLLSYIRQLTLKFKNLLYVGKQEINKIIDDTTIRDLKEKSKDLLNKNELINIKDTLEDTKRTLDKNVTDLYQATNLNYNLDNILKNHGNTKENESKNQLRE